MATAGEPVDGTTAIAHWTAEQREDGTLVRLTVQRAVKQREITPILEDLGINIVSFVTERDPGVATQGKRNLAPFRGSFLLCDDDGQRLDDTLLQQLVEALQRVLCVSITAAGTIRKSDSVSSNLSVAGSEHLQHTSLPPHINRLPSLSGSEAAASPSLTSRQQHAGDGGSSMSPENTHSHHQRGDSCTSHTETDSLLSGYDRSSSQHAPSQIGGIPGVVRHGSAGSPPELQHTGSGTQAGVGGGSGQQRPAGPGVLHSRSLSASSDATLGTLSAPTTAQTSVDGHGIAGALRKSPSTSTREEECMELAAGQQTVDNIMTSPVQCIHQDADLNTAKSLMSQVQVSALLVDTGSATPGIVTKRDFLKVSFSKTLKRGRVLDIMTQPVISIPLGTSLREAVRLIAVKGVRRVLVHDPSRADADDALAAYVGLVSDTDIFRVLGRPEHLMRRVIDRSLGVGGHASPTSEVSRQSVAPSLAHYPSNMSSVSGMSVCSLAHSISSLSEQAKAISTEDRYRAAAALWELDFNEIETTRKIGEGSFGEVVLANFRGTKVAVKRMRGFEISCDDEPQPSPTMMPVFAQFFEREIEIMASIRHPNVVNFIGACHTPPNVCLVTEYCARGSLDHLLHKSSLHLDLVKKIEFGMDIARGMSCLHAQRPAIVHRDLKPANLLVSARFEVKVADFGLSRIKDHAQLINSRAGLEGTIEYCAPEVLRGEPYTEKCDIWSCGVVLWELLNRQRPYADADVPIYILMMALGTGSLSLAPLREEASSVGLVRLVERCLARQPGDRPSFRDILHALENEYKVVRGKAAAVPRSDSANSVVVLGQHNTQHSESATDTPIHTPQPSQQPNLPRPPGLAAHPLPAQVAHAMGMGMGGRQPSIPRAVAMPVATSPGGSGSDGSGSDTHERTSAPAVQHAASRLGPLGGRQQAGLVAAGTGIQQDRSRPGAAPGGSSVKPGRTRNGRMSRARSTPLPAHMWFGDQGDQDGDEVSRCPAATSAECEQVPNTFCQPGFVTDQGVATGLPPLTDILEHGAWNPIEVVRPAVSEPARSDSGGGSGIGAVFDLADEAAAAVGMPAVQLASMQDLSLHNLVDCSAESKQPAVGHSSGSGHSLVSPFDGFLPFSDTTPDTPRINTASSLETLLTDAMVSATSIPQQAAQVLSRVEQNLPPISTDATAAAADPSPSDAQTVKAQPMSSPFSAFAQGFAPFSDEPSSPKHDDPLPVSPEPRLQPGQHQHASSAPCPMHVGKTGSFFSPFANMMSSSNIGTVDEGAWDAVPTQSEGDSGTEASSARGLGSAVAPLSTSTTTTTHAHLEAALASGVHHPMPDDGPRHLASREHMGSPHVFPVMCDSGGPQDAQAHMLATSMSMSLSMDTSSPVLTPFDYHIHQVSTGRASASPRQTVEASHDHTCRQVAVQAPVEAWAPALLTHRSSSSPTTNKAFEPLSPSSASPGSRSGRLSMDKLGSTKASNESLKHTGSPLAAGGESGDVTVHQISWVKV